MSGISTHILDTARGLPASGVAVTLEFLASPSTWSVLTQAVTDADGRVKSLLPAHIPLRTGTYRLRFDTAGYFAAQAVAPFFPAIDIVFVIADAARHHHVPLLLSTFGYTTYRGT